MPSDTTPAAAQLDARASDPVTMGWMAGSPPPADRLVRFADDSFFRFPRTRWSFSHMRELVPTKAVSRGEGPVRPLPRALRDDIDAVRFHPIGRSDEMTWAESLLANYTDGLLILHRGTIVYERYFGALTPERAHLAFSVSKSFVGTLAATLIAEGVLDADATIADYVPELGASGFSDATVQQTLDMVTGLDYTEDYTDQRSSVWRFSRAGSLRPRPPGYDGPQTFCEFLCTVGKASPHAERFAYKTVNTDAIAWVLTRVTGQSVSTLVGERLWSRLGVEHDAYFTIDTAGTEFAGGGLNLTLRDLARFGELMRLNGTLDGRSIVPTSVVEDIRRGGNRDHFALAGYATLPGWSYRSKWWVAHNEHGAFTARGIHGQAIYVDPAAEMVIVRFASHPLAANVNLDPTSLPAYHAVAKHLMGTASRSK